MPGSVWYQENEKKNGCALVRVEQEDKYITTRVK